MEPADRLCQSHASPQAPALFQESGGCVTIRAFLSGKFTGGLEAWALSVC